MSATVEGLCDEMRNARIEEFGDDDGSQRLPSVFFRTGKGSEAPITVTAPDGRISHRNPEYCATEVGGARLGNVVHDLGFDCAVVPGPAVELLGNWKESDTVPWIKLAQGPKLNAGQLLMFFNHNYPAAQVEKKLRQEINDALGHDSGTDRV